MLFSQSLCSSLSGRFAKFFLTSKPPTTSAFDTTTQPLRKGNIKTWFDRRNRNYLKHGREKKYKFIFQGNDPTIQGTLWLPSASPAPRAHLSARSGASVGWAVSSASAQGLGVQASSQPQGGRSTAAQPGTDNVNCRAATDRLSAHHPGVYSQN